MAKNVVPKSITTVILNQGQVTRKSPDLSPYKLPSQRVRVPFSSHYKAARELLATNLVILNHGQVTRTIPEGHAPIPSPNFHKKPSRGRLRLDIFKVHRLSLHGGLGSNSWHSSHESMTLTTSLPRPPNFRTLPI
ncbi:hypothetical protein TNCV_1710191 [Trichonephila clavipes]|nr:hypothetical protein TNCV_1710191 [Trichonephila clavipes]